MNKKVFISLRRLLAIQNSGINTKGIYQCFFFLIALLNCSAVSAQNNDSIEISLADAEKIFLSKNLTFLAAKYEVDAVKAGEIQAKLFDNPNFYFEQSVYNQYSKRYFPTATKYNDGSLGQNQLNVNQLFSLAGKRNKRLKLAKMNTQVAQYQFYDLLRTLMLQLRSNFYDLHFSAKIYHVYSVQFNDLENNLAAFKQQVDKGNVSLSEYMRLTSFLNSVKTEKMAALSDYAEANRNLHVLLGDTGTRSYKARTEKNLAETFDISAYNLKTLVDTALGSRADVKVQEFATKAERAGLEYQKAAAVPDLMIAGTYDRNGSYIQNYYGVGFGFQLPVFNRNQGNIRAAEMRLKERELDEQNVKLNVQQDVQRAYALLSETSKLYKSTDRSLLDKFPAMMKGLLENYLKRNISVIEFVDYYDSFKNNVIQLYQTENALYNNIENLNYEVGKTLIK